MHSRHHRRQIGNPFSNIFGSQAATTTTPSATATPTPSATNANTDPLGGLTSALGSILSVPSASSASASSSSVVVSSTTPSTTSTSITPTTSSTPTTTPTVPPTTLDVTVTSTSSSSTASSTTPSASASVSATLGSNSTVAATVAGTLIGVLALAMIVSFFLRRWKRNRSRVNPRESINFSPEEIRRTGTILRDNNSEKQYVEQKATSAYHVPAPAQVYQQGLGAYPYGHMQQQQQPPQRVYSPNPPDAYPTAAQQVAFQYRGSPTQASYNDFPAHPNPHPVSNPNDEAAYDGI